MNFPILHQLGLTENESLIYGLLLENGSMKASDIENLANIGRGNVYNTLVKLQKEGLVLSIEGKQTKYQPVNPAELRKILEKRLTEAKSLESLFQTQLPSLTSTFNLSTGKPAIQVFEGVEGSEKALADSLSSTGEILTYLDPDALTGPFTEINKRYVKRRIEKQLKKRILMSKTPKAEEYTKKMINPFTEIRFVEHLTPGFSTAMELYNNKVAFHTLTLQKTISFIIEDSSVAALHRAQFECLWKYADQIQPQSSAL